MIKPLQGIGVLDVGTMTPGKYCTYLLADLGAEVTRVERPVKQPIPVDDEDLVLNQGKKSIILNLRSEEGRQLFLRLVETADVVLESNRPGVADRNGVGYADIKQRNEKIIYCAMSGYGATGPLREAPGYDLIFTALSGVLQLLTGKGPSAPKTYIADGVSGLTATYAITAAIAGRERRGEGAFIDLSMNDSIFGLLAVSHGLQKPGQGEKSAATSPVYDVYEAANHTYLVLAAYRASSCQALFKHLGRSDLLEMVWGSETGRVASFLSETFKTKRAEEWVAELAPLDIEISKVNSPAEAFNHPQLMARGMIASLQHPQAGDLKVVTTPVNFDQSIPRSSLSPAPGIGQNTDSILAALGLSKQQIAELRKKAVV